MTTINDLIKELKQYDGNTPVVLPTYLDSHSRSAYGYSNLLGNLFNLREDVINSELDKKTVLALDVEKSHMDFDNDIRNHTANENFLGLNYINGADDGTNLNYLVEGVSLEDFKPKYYWIDTAEGKVHYAHTTKDSHSFEEKAGYTFATVRINGTKHTGIAEMIDDKEIFDKSLYDGIIL